MTIDDQVKQLSDDVVNLKQGLATHVHDYAAANSPSGPALTLKVDEDAVDELLVTGVSPKNLTKVMRNPLVKVNGDSVSANTFVGKLSGNADSATKLEAPFELTISGDVAGAVTIDGSRSVTMNVSLSTNGVSPGEYGPISNTILAIGDSFVVPELSVNSSGVITGVTNKTITFPGNVGVAGTTGATQFADPSAKLYVTGSPNQGRGETTYSDSLVYVADHKLFSNGSEVVTVDEHQHLTNKTYDGFTLGAACERGVDPSTTGVAGSDDLVTSNALKLHVHQYADADVSGNALRVKTSAATAKSAILVDGGGSTVAVSGVEVDGDAISAGTVKVANTLELPGGTLWIDPSAKAVDIAEYDSGKGTTTADRVITTIQRSNGVPYSADELFAADEVRLTSLEGKTADLNVDLKDANDKLDAISKQSSISTSTLTLLDTEVTCVKQSVSDLDERLVLTDSSVQSVATEVSEAKLDVTQLGLALNQTTQALTTVTSRVEDVEVELANFASSATMTAANAATAKAQATADAAQADVNALKQTVAQLSTIVDGFKTTLSKLSTSVDNMLFSSTSDVVQVTLLPGATYDYVVANKLGVGVSTFDRTFTLLVADSVNSSLFIPSNVTTVNQTSSTFSFTNIDTVSHDFKLTVR